MRSEKGAITLYVTIVCLFVWLIGITSYIGTTNRQAAQLAALNEIDPIACEVEYIEENIGLKSKSYGQLFSKINSKKSEKMA